MSRRIPERPRPDVSDVFVHLEEGKPESPFWEGFVVGVIVAVSFAFPLWALALVY